MDNVEKKRNIRVIFTVSLAEHLCKNGFFRSLKAIEKNKKPGFEKKKVYIFYNSDELEQAIEEYVSSKSNS